MYILKRIEIRLLEKTRYFVLVLLTWFWYEAMTSHKECGKQENAMVIPYCHVVSFAILQIKYRVS